MEIKTDYLGTPSLNITYQEDQVLRGVITNALECPTLASYPLDLTEGQINELRPFATGSYRAIGLGERRRAEALLTCLVRGTADLADDQLDTATDMARNIAAATGLQDMLPDFTLEELPGDLRI